MELLRKQVAAAQARVAAPGKDGDGGVHFELGEITVELGMELAETTGKEGGLKFAVMGVGLKGGAHSEVVRSATHKLTVRLVPHGPDGKPIDVRDRERG